MTPELIFLLIVIALIALAIVGTVTYKIVMRIKYKPGTGITKEYQTWVGGFDKNTVAENVLDSYNIPYSYARLKSISHNTEYGTQRKYTYILEYWPKNK